MNFTTSNIELDLHFRRTEKRITNQFLLTILKFKNVFDKNGRF